MHVTRQYRAYSFGEPIDFLAISGSCTVECRSSKSPLRWARRWAVNYYDRINYIVITTIWRCERTTGARSSRPSSRHVADFFVYFFVYSFFFYFRLPKIGWSIFRSLRIPLRLRKEGLIVMQRASQNSCCICDDQEVD